MDMLCAVDVLWHIQGISCTITWHAIGILWSQTLFRVCSMQPIFVSSFFWTCFLALRDNEMYGSFILLICSTLTRCGMLVHTPSQAPSSFPISQAPSMTSALRFETCALPFFTLFSFIPDESKQFYRFTCRAFTLEDASAIQWPSYISMSLIHGSCTECSSWCTS